MAFAEHADVQTRLSRTLTTAEQETATAVIATVTGLIVDEVDRDADWAAALDPVPEALKGLCVEKAIGAIANPQNLAVHTRTLGVHTDSRTFPRAQDVSVFLTPMEGRIARQAVYGTNTGSSTPRSVTDRIIDLNENRDVDEIEVEA